MLQPPLRSPQRRWSPLVASSAVHAGLLVLVTVLSRQSGRPEEGDRRDGRAEAARQTQMVYLAPPPDPLLPPEQPPPEPPAPPPLPPAAPETPPPPVRSMAPPPSREQPQPEPEANAPPDAVRNEGGDAPEPQDGGAPGPAAEAAPTMESEARRIFGRPRRLATRSGAGPQAVRPMEAHLPDDPAKCVPRPSAPSDSAGPLQFGTVEGRILRSQDGLPLGGAHLQMVGTPFTAFTDADGGYRFRFDLSLMDNCRTQYVRVSAKGYEARLLVLVVGANVRSEDVQLKKRGWW